MLMIFPTRSVSFSGLDILIPGAGLMVPGAAIATAMSEVIISLAALYLIATKNHKISLLNRGSWKWQGERVLLCS
jgi:Na+-driven multidrug efflux pump